MKWIKLFRREVFGEAAFSTLLVLQSYLGNFFTFLLAAKNKINKKLNAFDRFIKNA